MVIIFTLYRGMAKNCHAGLFFSPFAPPFTGVWAMV
jgi:hypothetical protein